MLFIQDFGYFYIKCAFFFSFFLFLFFFFFFFLFLLFRPTPMAYGSSQTRGWIGVVATSLHHVHHSHINSGSEWVCDLHYSSRQCQIPDPLSEARDRTHILMDTSRICFHCATMGTLCFLFIFFKWSFLSSPLSYLLQMPLNNFSKLS